MMQGVSEFLYQYNDNYQDGFFFTIGTFEKKLKYVYN